MDAPLVLTSKTHTEGAPLAVIGPAETLAAAFEAGAPVTLSGKMAGQTVYLGHRRYAADSVLRMETVGCDRVWDHQGMRVAAYLVDMTRLDQAPRIAELHARAQTARTERLIEQDRRVQAEDERLDNLAEDGA
jgi:hypothetical protein